MTVVVARRPRGRIYNQEINREDENVWWGSEIGRSYIFPIPFFISCRRLIYLGGIFFFVFLFCILELSFEIFNQ
jgi:hypothetical protein